MRDWAITAKRPTELTRINKYENRKPSNPLTRRRPRLSRKLMGCRRRSLWRDGLQYVPDRLSGSAHRSFLRRTDRLHDVSADWKLRCQQQRLRIKPALD